MVEKTKSAGDPRDAVLLSYIKQDVLGVRSMGSAAIRENRFKARDGSPGMLRSRRASPIDFLVQKKWLIRSIQGHIQDKYEFEDRVGTGAFGAVYRARDKEGGKWRQLKCVTWI